MQEIDYNIISAGIAESTPLHYRVRENIGGSPLEAKKPPFPIFLTTATLYADISLGA